MASKIKRKQYIVDNLQYKMLQIVIIYIMLGILVAGFLMFVPSILGLSGTGREKYEAAKEMLLLHQRFWPAMIVVTVILGGHSIFIFHRIFGPLYRFKCTMRDISQGDLSYNIKLRKNDFLKEEENIMNNMITSLRTELVSLKADNAHLAESIRELLADLEHPDISMDSVRDRVQDVKRKGEKLARGFEMFKTGEVK